MQSLLVPLVMLRTPCVEATDILVVDDSRANRRILTTLLEQVGYRVRSATNGRAGLRMAVESPPDLILLDITMPELSGYEVCQELKAHESLRQVPVIFISALAEQVDKVRAFATGGVDYITKPFHARELEARVTTHLKLRDAQRHLETAIARLAETNERISRDLKAAARIQESFLPHRIRPLPGVEFAWKYQPCDELAGDGLNVMPLGDSQVGLYILDVSGHGVASALLSVAMSRILSAPPDDSSTWETPSPLRRDLLSSAPAKIADQLNALFPFDLAAGQFATLIFGALDPRTGAFRYVSAGHPPPILLQKDGRVQFLESSGRPIGLADSSYKERSISLSAGDRIFLYTDGFPEAANALDEPLGSQRWLEWIADTRVLPLSDAVSSLAERFEAWRGTGIAKDDRSVLAIEFDPSAK